ncbi:MAG: CDP-glycerol glycerophosphotransferase family protein [Alphaproteobacteria bacterium]|nr:CDP-glycerol glycerophosphotransferase family protein [Alphaproteobacteria bacterium]
MFEAIAQWRAMRRFQALAEEQREIVFYSEGSEYWVHLEPLIRHLVNDFKRTVCYLSSQADDPGLAQDHPGILPFQIGDATVRTAVFRALKARVLVMTMPDLQTLYVKRSAYPVHYVHVFHAIVSTHMVYRKNAFDHFDTLFCVGPHHMEEVRRAEELYGLKPKNLVEHGYGRLDSIMHNAGSGGAEPGSNDLPRILLAPSWGGFGRQGLLETAGRELITTFLDAGFHVTLRPHPMTRRLLPEMLAELVAKFADRPHFVYEGNVAPESSLHAADLMLSDWSGASFDYAYGLERPVLFIDVPRKINNADHGELGIEPLEAKVRSEIGVIVPPDQIARAPEVARQLVADAAGYAERIRQSRSRWVYNVGNSGRRGAEHVIKLCQDLAPS